MKITIKGLGKFPNSFVCSDEAGKNIYLSGGKFLRTTLEIGRTYEIETWQKEGQKTVYINKAVLVGDAPKVEPVKPAILKPVAPRVAAPVKAAEDDSKMTKADWEKKDQGIKWISCLKTSAEFHARRSESNIKLVIDDAIRLYYAVPGTHEAVLTSDDDTDVAEGTKDIFEANDL